MLKKNNIIPILFALMAVIYLATAKGYIAVSDSVFSLRTAQAIVEKGSLAIDAAANEDSWVFRTPSGKAYSQYGIGLPILWVPVGIAARMLSPLIGVKMISLMDFLASFYNIFFGAGSCVLVFLMTRRFGSSYRGAVSMALIFGLCTLCWRYSVWDCSEAAQMCMLLAAAYHVILYSRQSIVVAGAFFSCMILFKVFSLIYMPVFIFYIFLKGYPDIRVALKNTLYFLIAPAAGIVFILVMNYLRFGNAFETGYGSYVSMFYIKGAAWHDLQLLISLNKGIFVYCPIFLLSAAGYILFFRQARKEALFFIMMIVVNLGILSTWFSWDGGAFSWGPRYLVPIIPFWFLPLFTLFKKGPFIKTVMVFLVLLSFFIELVGVLQSDHEYHHIRYNEAAKFGKEIQKKMPSDIVGMIIILKHKLSEGGNVYRLSEFGIDSGAIVDTSSVERYRGFNLWYYYLATKFDKPLFRYAGFLFLPFIALLFMRLFKRAGALDAVG